MEAVVNDISFSIDRARLWEALGQIAGGRNSARPEEMAAEAESVGRPSAVYRVSHLTGQRDDGADIGGIGFNGPLLAENLSGLNIVFPFIATSGPELEKWALSFDDMLNRYCADVIVNLALYSTVESLKNIIAERHGQERLSMMNPGSLESWPLEEQKKIFELLGPSAAQIGVALSDSLVMRPSKSLSGLFFTSNEGFVSCSRCPRDDCFSRRASYNTRGGHDAGQVRVSG